MAVLFLNSIELSFIVLLNINAVWVDKVLYIGFSCRFIRNKFILYLLYTFKFSFKNTIPYKY